VNLADPDTLGLRRAALLAAPHLAPLCGLLVELRAAHGRVPDPDPLDGGVRARLLLLLESPGPSIGRTGFVSRDNPTGTARNLKRFLEEAGIAREDTLIWNAVPWVIHAEGATNRAPREGEIRAGLAALPPLLGVLRHLEVVVLAGRVAARARPTIAAARPDLALVAMPHPSPTFVVTSPAVPARIRAALADAAALLAGGAQRED
jgi:uracil-DNA glycosylase